jgi:hypothetical protein
MSMRRGIDKIAQSVEEEMEDWCSEKEGLV